MSVPAYDIGPSGQVCGEAEQEFCHSSMPTAGGTVPIGREASAIRVRDCAITHLLSVKNLNVDDFHVSIAINI